MYQDGAQVRPPAGGEQRQHPVRRHQAPGARDPARGGAALPDAVRRPPLARRHADQLQDRQAVDQAAEGNGAMPQDGTFERISKKEALGLQRELAKLQRSLGGIKDLSGLPDALFVIDVGYQKGAVHGGQQARHAGDRRGRHQPLARRHRLRDPGQRRLEPRHPPVRARHGRRGARRPQPGRWKRWSPPRATSSSRWKKKRVTNSVASTAQPQKRGLEPLFFNLSKEHARMAEISAAHGEGTARAHRPGNDGMQEGAGRGRRRHEEGRGAAAHQERRQGEQGREPRRGRRRRSAPTSRPTASSARWSR